MIRRLVEHFEEVLGSLLLAVMALIAFVNVIVRYCTSFSFAWTEEITINFFVWIVLLGTARCFRSGGHLGMTVVYNAFPRWLRRLCYFVSMLACVVFFGALCWTGGLEVLDEMQLGVTSESLGIPVWWYTLATPVFSVLIIVRMLQRAVEDLRTGAY